MVLLQVTIGLTQRQWLQLLLVVIFWRCLSYIIGFIFVDDPPFAIESEKRQNEIEPHERKKKKISLKKKVVCRRADIKSNTENIFFFFFPPNYTSLVR